MFAFGCYSHRFRRHSGNFWQPFVCSAAKGNLYFKSRLALTLHIDVTSRFTVFELRIVLSSLLSHTAFVLCQNPVLKCVQVCQHYVCLHNIQVFYSSTLLHQHITHFKTHMKENNVQIWHFIVTNSPNTHKLLP